MLGSSQKFQRSQIRSLVGSHLEGAQGRSSQVQAKINDERMCQEKKHSRVGFKLTKLLFILGISITRSLVNHISSSILKDEKKIYVSKPEIYLGYIK